MTKITTTNPDAQKWQELERIKAAADRLVRRAQKDPEVARAFLRDIGYYAMMSQIHSENDTATVVKDSASKAAPAKRKRAKDKR